MTALFEARGIALAARLQATDLEVPAGQLTAVIGPNGGGKTSLLRALGAIEASSGSATIDREAIATAPPARRPRLVGFMPASREIAWPILARDIIALGLPAPDAHRVEELIGILELESLADRPVDRLSTGERTRVLLARTLAPRPRLLLLDEPLSNLDPYWVLRMIEVLRSTVAAGAAALVALHDIELVPAFDRALLVADGAIRADLPPEDMLASEVLAEAFRILRSGNGWRVSPRADRRSSP
ncbi:ATP-binding cassette domain-containing protein [Sphingomonas sp. URHD0057]|uniref:ATP-binding cassette domain-containing protein n=1 Tax=Sphingomonas sp. URHD0057 TaxID=1380389 RepID=UPI0006861AD7|nr:ABC transporter ATP-binding protein [Sphingomonas sp. URHD0057]